MCGIGGYINLDGRELSPEQGRRILLAMGVAMEHRGPDDTHTMLWNNVGFVFKRLAIVDLDTGQQPFEAADGRLCAMVNGEIYNHREIRRSLPADYSLKTHSDCEVIPYLYLNRGKGLFEPVNGMFAAAILDRQQGRLLLARDRIGIKPLFYCITEDGKQLVFASELKALFAHPGVPRVFDWHAALSLEKTQDTRGRELPSFYRGVNRLPAGSILDLDLHTGQHSVDSYWQLPQRDSDQRARPQQWYIDHYREILEDSVRMRLMTDVDLGVFLSGGVDSAAVAALASRYQTVPTFSVSSKSTLGSGDMAASVQVADYLKQPNHQVFFNHRQTEITPDHWRQVLWTCELPQSGPEQLYKYYLHAFARQKYPNLKVILLGQGADEFAGGYMDWAVGAKSSWQESDWAAVEDTMRMKETLDSALEAGYLLAYKDVIERGYLKQDFICQSANRSLDRSAMDMYQGYYRQNLDTHLWHEDRTSSASSIESRVPFLDHRLLEFLAAVPVVRHPALFTDKKILRYAVQDVLPNHIAHRPKGYFYFGDEQRHTFQLMYSILVAHDRELIDQAIAGSELTDGPLARDKFHDYVSEVGRDPQYGELLGLLKLINMGLLAEMAAKYPASVIVQGGLPRQELPVRELDAGEIREMIDMPAQPGLAQKASEIDQSIPGFAPATELSKAPSSEHRQILQMGVPKMKVLSPGWESFITAMDGRRTVAEILGDQGLPRTRILKQLRQAVSDKLIVLSEP